MDFVVGSVCDRGLSHKRPVNEDRALVRPDAGLFVVCDGVGGHSSGEVASQMAIDTIEEALAHAGEDSLDTLLSNAVSYANRDIFEMAASDPRYFGMGTTIALLYLDPDHGRAIIAHAGDSRVYRYDSTLHRETYDHTDQDDAVRAGRITEAQALLLGKQNTINRALGIEATIAAEFSSIDLAESDQFLLCSDGVTRHIDDGELEALFRSDLTPTQICEKIRELCYARGAEDNLTAVVVSTVATSAKDANHPLEIPIARASRVLRGENATLSNTGDARTVRAPGRAIVLLAIAAAAIAGLLIGRLSVAWSARTPAPVPPATAARDAFDRGDYQTSAAGYERLAAQEPARADLQFWIGRSHLAEGSSQQAIEHLERSASLDSNNPETYLYLAAAYKNEHRDKEADEALRRYSELRTPAGRAPSSTSPPASNANPGQ